MNLMIWLQFIEYDIDCFGLFFQVPIEFNFLQVMDLYFKIHFIFSVPFEPSLAQFMGVFEKYVFGIESDTKISPVTKNKAKSLFSLPAQSNDDNNQDE